MLFNKLKAETSKNDNRINQIEQIVKTSSEPSTTKMKKTLNILNSINPGEYIGRNTTSLSNLIFMKDRNGDYSEQYKDFLKNHDLTIGYYEIPRLLHYGQYEQASLLALAEYKTLSQNPDLEDDKLMHSLYFHAILEEASKRNDTIMLIEYIKLLQKTNSIAAANYGNIIVNAILNENVTLLEFILPKVMTKISVTDNLIEKLFDLILKNEKNDLALQLLSIVQSEDIKNRLCLKLLSGLEFNNCMSYMENLIESNILVLPSNDKLPASFISIPNLNDFTVIDEHLDVLKSLKLKETKQMYLYSLLSSINNQNNHLGCTIRLLNGIREETHLLTEEHQKIIFQQISKYSYKLTGIKLMHYFKALGLPISKDNYFKLVKFQFGGSENETVYPILVETIKEHNKLSSEIVDYLKFMSKKINDTKLTYFFNANIDNHKIEDIKVKIDYSFINDNLELERERQKVIYKPMKNFLGYDYHDDIALSDALIF
ncbi:hypothetical protein DAPK24_025440 [Pichia kluyveri]|uniref:ATPase expression protein 1 n=1 Tax=Pichia kluyveri TaxID=36015 RepID=A0AAV5R346_PICKL|nr:hypothetical protein DAPK24_025440 [Pichia kluyveri]